MILKCFSFIPVVHKKFLCLFFLLILTFFIIRTFSLSFSHLRWTIAVVTYAISPLFLYICFAFNLSYSARHLSKKDIKYFTSNWPDISPGSREIRHLKCQKGKYVASIKDFHAVSSLLEKPITYTWSVLKAYSLIHPQDLSHLFSVKKGLSL